MDENLDLDIPDTDTAWEAEREAEDAAWSAEWEAEDAFLADD